jgi:hypothetical protein
MLVRHLLPGILPAFPFSDAIFEDMELASVAARDFAGARAPFSKTLALSAAPLRWLLVSAELEQVDKLKVKAGAELSWSQFAVRGGRDGANPVAGFGLNAGRASVDYAVVFHSKLGLVHQLSVAVFR